MSFDTKYEPDVDGRFTDDQGRVWRIVPPVDHRDMKGTLAEGERLLAIVKDVCADSDARIDAHEKLRELVTLMNIFELPNAEDANYDH